MEFSIEEKYLAWLVMGFLREKKCFEALSAFQLESELSEGHDSNEALLYIQKLVLQGRWDDIVEYIEPLHSKLELNYDKLMFIIRRQQFLELLSWQGGGGHKHALLPWTRASRTVNKSDLNVYDQDELSCLLKLLEKYCTRKEFNSLLSLMSLERLCDHPDYREWNVSLGRIDSLQTIRKILKNIIPSEDIDTSISSSSSGLSSIVAMGLAYQSKAQSNLETQETKWNRLLRIPHPVDGQAIPTHQIPQLDVLNPIECRSPYYQTTKIKQYQTSNESDILPPPPIRLSQETLKQSVSTSNKLLPTQSISNNFDVRLSKDNVSEVSTLRVSTTIHPPSIAKPSQVSSPRMVSAPAAVSWTVGIEGETVTNPSMPPVPPPTLRSNSRLRSSREENAVLERKQLSVNNPWPQKDPRPDDEISVTSKISKDSQATLKSKSSKSTTKLATTKVMHKKSFKIIDSSSSEDILPTDSPIQGTSALVYHTSYPIRSIVAISSEEQGQIDLAVGSNAKSVHVIRASTSSFYNKTDCIGNILVDYPDVHHGSIYAMDFCAATGSLVTASNDKTIRICNVHRNSWSFPLKSHNGTIRTLKFGFSDSNPIGSIGMMSIPPLASAGAGDCRPRIWDINTGVCLSSLSPHADTIHGLSWLDVNILVTGCENGDLLAHDIRIGESIWKTKCEFGVCSLSMMQTSSIHLGVAGCVKGHVLLFDPSSGRVLQNDKLHNDDIRALTALPPSQQFPYSRLVTTSFDGTAAIWKQNSELQEFGNLCYLDGVHTDKLLSVSVVNQTIFTSGADGRVVAWKI